MRILSNAFPTNLPNSEKISQGGPANFARLFNQYIADTNAPHEWVGVMLEATPSNTVRLQHVFTMPKRRYFRLRMPKSAINSVTKSVQKEDDPNLLWAKPIARLEKLLREQKVDVVFLNGFGIFNWMLLKAGHRAGVPVVIQHAGIWTKELGIHKDRYTVNGRRLLEAMEKESTQLSSVEVFLNRWSRDYYRDKVASGEAHKTEVVPLPFNFQAFEELSRASSQSKFAFEKGVFHIGIIARWDEIKNHAAVLAMAKLARKNKLPWRFHAVVEIPEQYKKEAQIYRRYVDVIAPLDRAGISDFCRSVDLLLLPSLFDVSPTVVLEAASLNTPIAISPNVGFVRDFISCGAAAWVIDPSDTEGALQAISRIRGVAMPTELRQTLLYKHDHAKVFATYLQIFKEARLRDLPLWEVVKILWRQEWARFIPWMESPDNATVV